MLAQSHQHAKSSSDGALIKRAIPEPGGRIEPYHLSADKFQDRLDYHTQRNDEEKADRAADKLWALEHQHDGDMKAYALKHRNKIHDAKNTLRRQQRRLRKRLAKKRSYKLLARAFRDNPDPLRLAPVYVRRRLRGPDGRNCVWRQEPQKSWQTRSVEAAELTGRRLNHFDAVGANTKLEVYGSLPYSEHNESKRQKGQDQFTAVVHRDIDAAREIVNYHQERIPALREDIARQQTAIDYYTPKFHAWANLAARYSGQRPIPIEMPVSTDAEHDDPVSSSDEGSTTSTRDGDYYAYAQEDGGSNYTQSGQQHEWHDEHGHDREEGYHISDSNYNNTEEGPWSAAIDYENYFGENENGHYHSYN